MVFVVAWSFSEFGSLTLVATVTMFSSSVPLGVPGGMCTTSVKLSIAPAGSDGLPHVTVPPLPAAGVVQLHPPGAERDTNVVGPGSVSVTVASAAAAGPPLVTVISYVRSPSGTTPSGADWLTPTSATVTGPTRVLAVLALFSSLGSKVVVESDAVSEMNVPGEVPGFTCKVSVKAASAPAASVAIVHDTVPPPPAPASHTGRPGAVLDERDERRPGRHDVGERHIVGGVRAEVGGVDRERDVGAGGRLLGPGRHHGQVRLLRRRGRRRPSGQQEHPDQDQQSGSSPHACANLTDGAAVGQRHRDGEGRRPGDRTLRLGHLLDAGQRGRRQRRMAPR